MKVRLSIGFAFVLGTLFGQLMSSAASAQLPRRTVKTTRLQTIDLADYCSGKEVTVELNEIAPGTSGKHYHPGHSFTYVLEGSEHYVLDGESSRTVHTGDLLHEAPMQLHTVDNSKPVKLLVLRVIEKGKQATVQAP
jgi:quercetin dioxygenase-like cupin family protein